MNNKKIFCMSSILLTSTIFGFKNNQSQEKMSDFNFLEKHKIACQADPSREKCDMRFNYKQEIISLQLVRNYDPNTNKIIIRKISFKNNSSAGFFYGQVLSNKSHLHFPFNDFINFIKNLTIVYSNDLNTIDIEINDGSKNTILNTLKEFTKNLGLKEEETYLNTLDPANFNYNDLKHLKFIAEDFSVLEAFLLDISIKNKVNMITKTMDDISFSKDIQIKGCARNTSRANCRVNLNYKQKIIPLNLTRIYSSEKITLKHLAFLNNEDTKIFYENELLKINSLKFNKDFKFEDFNTFLDKFIINYLNDSDSIKIEFIENKKEIIYSNLINFLTKSIELTVNDKEINQTLTNDLNYLNTIAPTDFNYEKLKKLQFISVDLDSLEKLLLEIIRNHKDEMIPSDE
ncbi:hypothetical protein [Spirobacillus cienkowskii]|uniref:hypothetical protein n=1 Tax=Spirobacillus cienkowskii TaxID=495820 RepID=UPI0030D584BE